MTTTCQARNGLNAVATVALVLLVSATQLPACSRDVQAYSPEQLQRQYGINDAYTGQVATPDGSLKGTLVPVTLPDGRKAELIIPDRSAREPHPVYYRDDQGLHPVALQPNSSRQQFASGAPTVVARQPEVAHAGKRSWEKELLIVGGSAGAGTAVGALTGGKKGAGIGAAAGGAGGLIYDLMTRNKK
jgi:hypothetical protein